MLKNAPKYSKNSQTPQEPLFFHTKSLQPLKIPQIPPKAPKMTILPFKAVEAISFYPKLHFL
jgi:hypothetical protein